MVQVVEQTHEEKVRMYMKRPKKELVEMLINCNDIIAKMSTQQSYESPYSPTATWVRPGSSNICPLCGFLNCNCWEKMMKEMAKEIKTGTPYIPKKSKTG